MTKKPAQSVIGKAFEYALLKEFYERLSLKTKVRILNNAPYEVAKSAYNVFSESEQNAYMLNASFAVNFLLDLEPRLSNGLTDNDILQLEIVSDKEGQSGDVRDVLAIRSSQNWEIGISAKNNHRAVKHSRLSEDLDFGEKWLGLACSGTYFSNIAPVFSNLKKIAQESNNTKKWRDLSNKQTTVYRPVLDAFKQELMRLNNKSPELVAARLVEYLVGVQDFYKIIKTKKKVEIQAYNLHGTLNLPFKKIKAKGKVEKLKLPTRLIEVIYKTNSNTTLIVSLDEGWQISFRIHSAKTLVDASLKFDINLISAPKSLFTNHSFTQPSEK